MEMSFVYGALGRPSCILGKVFPGCPLSGHQCPVGKPNPHICSKSELWGTPALVCYWDLIERDCLCVFQGRKSYFIFLCVWFTTVYNNMEHGDLKERDLKTEN